MSSNRRRLIFHCSREWSEKASEQVAPTSERAMLSVSRGERDPPPRHPVKMRGKQMKYAIIWHSQYGKEEVDECDTLKEAHFLKSEYQMAYGGSIEIVKKRG